MFPVSYLASVVSKVRQPHIEYKENNNNQKSTVMPHATGPSPSDTFGSDPSAQPPPHIQVPPGTPASENPPGSNSQNGATDQASWSYGYVNPRCYDSAPADEYVEIRLRTGGPDVVLEGEPAAAARFNAGPWSDDLPVKVLFSNGSRAVLRVEAWSGELPSGEI
ncbi:hypothetical protein HO173_011324 [Letharia columbiana]|uniref:Uncharacterized protein n=1 Tax=Letharia columbiana TaxID=112416 RepID=A0A8H6KZ85_9LECA|nr:uncharacterized protein HO173_011324 [Letharia columbiana]KAF6229678.1 hypothetical protein HO173_011324 [Letharia columbiana]